MFQPTQILRNEHEVILKALNVLEDCCELIRQGTAVPPETLESLIEFFRLYADRCHHGKEEDLRFPALEAKGIPREGGPIGCMLHEHEQNRALTRAMLQAVAELRSGNAEALQTWAETAEQYSEVLSEHIYKENNILFVMAERAFSEAEEPALMARFNQVNDEKIGRAEITRLEAMVGTIAGSLHATA